MGSKGFWLNKLDGSMGSTGLLADLRVQRLNRQDVATTLAAKPTAKSIVALPPYNKLNKLDGLDKLLGGSAQQAQRVFGLTSPMAQRA
jgi:hypothetical protein